MKLKIMPEFNSSGIWDLDTGIMIDYEELVLTHELVQEFKDWIEYYDRSFNWDVEESKNFRMQPDRAETINNKGRELARKIKQCLNSYTCYQGELEGYDLLPLEEIE